MTDQASAVISEAVLVEHEGAITTITLNNPGKLNALSPEMLAAIPPALGAAVAQGARAIVLTGAGRAFCAGAQLGAGDKDGDGDGVLGERDLGAIIDELYNPVARALADCPVPIVVALNGVAAGAGASLALAGDIIVAGQSSYVSLAFAKIGLIPDCGATWLVAQAVGRVRTLEMALLGEKLMAADAHAAGLITRVVADDEVLNTAAALARQLAAMPTMALAMIRQQIRTALDDGFGASLLAERDNQRRAGYSADHVEGVMAFREKRSPAFKGA